MIRTVALVFAFFLEVTSASTTVGWNLPIEKFVHALQTNPKARKLDRASGESAFFKPGDELWDISAALEWKEEEAEDDPFDTPNTKIEATWPGEWIVWNARSRMVVARASFMELQDAEQKLGFDESPTLMRMRFELSAVPPAKEESRSLTLTCLSGVEAEGKMEGLKITAQAVAGSSGRIELVWTATWPPSEPGVEWKAASTTNLEEAREHLLARHRHGTTEWKLTGKVSTETIEGRPKSESRWIELPKQVVAWPPSEKHSVPVRRPLHASLQIGVYPVSAHFFYRGDLVLVDPPASLSEWRKGPVIDARKALRELGIKIEGEGTFAGFDPVGGQLLLIAAAQDQDLVNESLAQCCGTPAPVLWAKTKLEDGDYGLSCQSGMKAHISLSRNGETEQSFEISPSVDDDNTTIEVPFKVTLAPGKEASGRSFLIKNQSSTVASFSRAGGKTDVILSIHDHAPD